MGIWQETIKSIREAESKLSTPAKWILTFLLVVVIFGVFWWGVCVASVPYADRYPVEYSWWIDHERLHYPGVSISNATTNTSCRQPGNIRPPSGESVTQIQWLGGWDAGFVGNIKIHYNGQEAIVPTPSVGYCIYLYNVSGEIIVYGQDSASGGWIQLGKRSINSSITS